MKKGIGYFLIGLMIGIIITVISFSLFDTDSNLFERKRDAILYAQEVINKEYYQENSLLDFPALTKTNVEITDFGTYMVEFYVTFVGGRWVEDKYNPGMRLKERGANFLVELDYENESWKVIESKLIKYK